MNAPPLRFLVSVDQEWQVTVSCPALDLAGPGRAMRKLPDAAGGFFPLAPVAELSEQVPEAERPACCRLYCCTEDAAVLTEGRRRITDRNPDLKIGTSPFGGYLFHALIGAATWKWIRDIAADQRAQCIELALSWNNRDANLNRLNWEMMHDGQGFLAAGRPGVTIAITRLVAGTRGDTWEPRQVEFPPRILFVVGTTLNDPSIRPAAEFLGLLRELQESGRRIRARVLEKARPRELERVISVFRPDVIHFICHGNWDRSSGRGYLELAPDDPNGDRTRHADQLYAAMTVGALPPPLVVLSACRTGSAEAPPPDVLEGAHDLAPLATELVSLGVPLVLGMAGRVSDTACRLFTRQFGDALVRGESLVVATAEARRATVSQGRSADESVDWAFPALFAAEQVDPGFAPVPPGAADSLTQEENWIQDYDLERVPVFCGRNDFFQAYYGFFGPTPQRVLAIVADGQSGVGRTRLLLELATQMLRDGHIPIILTPDTPDWKPPQSLREFAASLADAIRGVRRILDLNTVPESQLAILLEDRSAPSRGQPSLRRDIAIELAPDGELTAVALRLALQADLRRLLKDARRQHESVQRAEGRVMILLDQVEKYGAVMPELIYRMLDASGFGTSEEPIPAVLALAMGQPTNTVVRDTLEQVASRRWLHQVTLKPFDFETEEDLLAYSWILLNPPPNFSIGRYFLNYGASREVVEIARGIMQTMFKGLPGEFANRDKFEGFTKSFLPGRFVQELPSDQEDRTTLTLAVGQRDWDERP
jgi:CHAT domain